jgi:hypothetical protein
MNLAIETDHSIDYVKGLATWSTYRDVGAAVATARFTRGMIVAVHDQTLSAIANSFCLLVRAAM